MKGIHYIAILGAAGLVLAAMTTRSVAQSPGSGGQRWEVGMIKWDGPDKLQLITPQKSEAIRLFKTGVTQPPDIHDEEFCLTWAANKLAQEGWEPVNLNATRILMRRSVSR